MSSSTDYSDDSDEDGRTLSNWPNSDRVHRRRNGRTLWRLRRLRRELRNANPQDDSTNIAHEVALEVAKEIGPQETDAVAPQGADDVAPQGADDVAPQGADDVAQQGADDVAPQGADDVAPQGADDVAPQGADDVAPQAIAPQNNSTPVSCNNNILPSGFNGQFIHQSTVNFYGSQVSMHMCGNSNTSNNNGASEPMQSTSSDQTEQQQQKHRMLGDVIYEIVLNKFSELTDQHTAPYSRYKVIAGVVMTTNDADLFTGARLVSMATGSKCIAGEFVSNVGKTVTDLHAENLAVRGCRLFILKELQRLQMYLKTGRGDDPSELIVQQNPSGDEEGFVVRPSVKFHLFVSTAPCGHARILSSHEQTDNDPAGDPDSDMDDDDDGGGVPRPSRRVTPEARLWAKVESGEGTVPVSAVEHVQTWARFVYREKLLAMSCTDRITRWNVLGIQGSLLSHLMKPVYIDNIVMGRMYNNRHLKHAFYGRIDHRLTDLPADYRLNRPLISPITHPGARNTQKAPDYSVHWVDDGTPMEVIGAARGRLVNGDVSKISKSEFYRAFVHLMEYSGYDFWRRRNVIVDRMTYAEVKAAAGTHRKVKVALYEALKAAGLGTWVHCPREQQEFTIEDY